LCIRTTDFCTKKFVVRKFPTVLSRDKMFSPLKKFFRGSCGVKKIFLYNCNKFRYGRPGHGRKALLGSNINHCRINLVAASWGPDAKPVFCQVCKKNYKKFFRVQKILQVHEVENVFQNAGFKTRAAWGKTF